MNNTFNRIKAQRQSRKQLLFSGWGQN